MADRYQEDLKRIIGIDEVLGGLSDAPVRESIVGKRGIAYQDASGTISGISGTPGETTAPSDAESNSGADSNGDFSDNIVPQSGAIVDGDSLLNNDELKIGDTLKELQVSDCESGKDMNIRFDGEFPAPDATFDEEGNQLTEAWGDDEGITSAENPPELFGWVKGFDSVVAGLLESVTISGYARAGAASSATTYMNSNVQSAAHTPGTYALNNLIKTDISTEWTVDLEAGGSTTFPLSNTIASCTIDVDEFCPTIAPTEEFWPTTGDLENTFYMKLEDGSLR